MPENSENSPPPEKAEQPEQSREKAPAKNAPDPGKKLLNFFEKGLADVEKGFKDLFKIRGKKQEKTPAGTPPASPPAEKDAPEEKPDAFQAGVAQFGDSIGGFFKKLKHDFDGQVEKWKAQQEADKQTRQEKAREQREKAKAFFDRARQNWDATVQKWKDDWKKAGEDLEAGIEKNRQKMENDWRRFVQQTREDYRETLKFQSRATARIMFNIMLVLLPIIIVVVVTLALLRPLLHF